MITIHREKYFFQDQRWR